MYYPAIIFAAGTIGLIFADILNKDTKSIAGHAFFGILLVIVSIVLSQNGADLVAWGLLVLPMIVLLVSFIMVVIKGPWGESTPASPASRASPESPESPESPASGCKLPEPGVQMQFSIQLPSSISNNIPAPLTQAISAIQGTVANSSTQPAAITDLSQPLSAYVSNTPNRPSRLTPASSCTT